MIWILIFVIANGGSERVGAGAVVAEFNNKAACMSAASEVRKQAVNRRDQVLTLLCAEKGVK